MSSLREALANISSQFETWTRTAVSGAPVSFQDLVTQTASPEAELKKLGKGTTTDLCIFLAACLGGFRAIDFHLRSHTKGAPQSITFRRVDIWGRLKAFEILSEEFSEAFFNDLSSESERVKVSTALLTEIRDISDLMMSELALRGELTRIGSFIEWMISSADRLRTPDKATGLLAAG